MTKAGKLAATRPKRGAAAPGWTPAEAPAAQKRDVRLGYLIHDVSRLRRNAFDQLMRPLGVTRSQWWVLAYLSRQDGMMQTQLAAILDVGKASLGSVLDRLESGGWIKRVADPIDRRVKRVFLTRSSQQLVETMSAHEQVFNEQILAGLTAADRDRLIDALSVIKTALGKLSSEAAPGA